MNMHVPTYFHYIRDRMYIQYTCIFELEFGTQSLLHPVLKHRGPLNIILHMMTLTFMAMDYAAPDWTVMMYRSGTLLVADTRYIYSYSLRVSRYLARSCDYKMTFKTEIATAPNASMNWK